MHLFERDCSVQRRHQKVLEEAPAPGMTPARRDAMGAAAVAAAKAIGYVGAGTVEFIAEQDGQFFFMEMNTRLQVEHPVTEMITGLDLVEWQLRVAAGEPLPLAQQAITIRGHAIEARIYAEDPAREFLPSIGDIVHWRMPDTSADVRVDTGFREGDRVTPYYDPMLAKLIVHGDDRDAALRRMRAALAQCEVAGVTTNIAFLERMLVLPAFTGGMLDTGLIERHRDVLLAPAAGVERALAIAAIAEWQAPRDSAANGDDAHSPWNATDAWWLNSDRHRITFDFDDANARHRVTLRPRQGNAVDVETTNAAFSVTVHHIDGECLTVVIDGERTHARVVAHDEFRYVFGDGLRQRFTLTDPVGEAHEEDAAGGHLRAPMSGTIVAVHVKPGDAVAKGAPLVVLEAMKMEHTIVAPRDGKVTALNCAPGERVAEGAALVDLED